MQETPLGPTLRYPWQRAVFEALLEYHADRMPDRIRAAERAVSGRLLERPEGPEELLALKDALSALRLVFPGSKLKLDSIEEIKVPGLD